MKLQIKTMKLQEMVARAVKGASNDKLIPITGLMAIDLKNGVLTLTTTDGSNYLKIIQKDIGGDDFYVVLETETFSKLISKITTDGISLELKENSLEVIGNGTYNFELPLNEEGQLIKFPEYSFKDSVKKQAINLSTIKNILLVNKAALADTMVIPYYTGYYCNQEEVITTDQFKICHNAINIFNKPILLPSELMELLNVMSEEKITVQENNGDLLFVTPDCVIFGTVLPGIEEYDENIEVIKGLINTEFKSMCKIPKQALLSLLDRIALFIDKFDSNALILNFTKDGLMISSQKSTGVELIKYQGSNNFNPFLCRIDLSLLKSQISAQISETIELWYGLPEAIKIVDGKVTQIIALLQVENNE